MIQTRKESAKAWHHLLAEVRFLRRT